MSSTQTSLPHQRASEFHLDSRLQLSLGQISSPGIKPVNEDAIGIRVPIGALLTTKGAVAVIADGVSAAEAGREASETCVSNFLSDYFSTPESWSVKKSAQQVLTALNRWLYGQGRQFSDSRRGYVSTFSAAIFKSRSVHLLHAGDSRIYRFRDGEFEQLTRDHRTVISEKQTYLSRALGLDIMLDVDYQKLPIQAGDVYLLSTDGLHDFIGDRELRETMSGLDADLELACKNLTDVALARGSDDNISCQLLRIDALPEQTVDDVVSRLTELAFPPFLKVGMRLDGYLIKRELHASSRSQVYLVLDEASGQQYCMKTPSVNFEDDASYIERFVMESWIGSRINSPHVVKVIESTRDKSYLYYLTEYVDGITLTQWMHEHPQPPVEEVVYLTDQMAGGLRAFHRRETLHQDIKPDNIMIDAHGRVKIIDFGSCYVAGIAEISAPLLRETALGTASYCAPEYVLGKPANFRSDLFSLAVISYEMLTGVLPFAGKLEHCKSVRDFMATQYTPSYRLNPLIPIWIDGALRKGMRLQEGRRHREVAEFAYELRHPNAAYLEYRHRPLIEKDPLLVWKMIAGGLLLSQLVFLYLML
jgi:serine/threonine protein phosphatase PrpC